jgi:hypothetical protein
MTLAKAVDDGRGARVDCVSRLRLRQAETRDFEQQALGGEKGVRNQ